MKKQLITMIVAISVIAFAISAGTYAFLTATAKSTNRVETNSEEFGIIYTGGTAINGQMKVGSSKDNGYNTTVHIRTTNSGVKVKADLYINIEEITSNIAVEGFTWEVYGIKNSQEVYSNSGNFNGYNATTNKKVKIVDAYELSSTDTAFTVYLWLDGSKTGNDVIGGTFRGFIDAKSENFTGQLPASSSS